MPQQEKFSILNFYQSYQQKYGCTPQKNVETISGQGRLTRVIITLFTKMGRFQAGGRTRREAHAEVCRLASIEPHFV